MDDKLKHIQSHFKTASEKVKSATEKVVNHLKSASGTVANHPTTQSAIKKSKKFCDEKGITDKAIKVGNKVNDSKKTFTGEKALEELTKIINLQECYNDLLATKLEEALHRIEILEQRLDKAE